MRVGVCDFPSAYRFPPDGYGGIERWLWAVAHGAQRDGHEVHLLGPSWRPDLPAGFGRLPVRLEDLRPGDDGFRQLAQLDLDVLIVGHEYPSLPAWRSTWSALGCRVATFQHDPNFRHASGAFDDHQARLFCYSPEMVRRYGEQRPAQTLSVQFGLGEEAPPPASRGQDLVWLGRIDEQKAPHIAVEAARLLGRRIQLIGPVLDENYARQHQAALHAPHVELVGEVAGPDKLELLRRGQVMVYTCARDYVEAGAAVFGESLRSGTPVAALAWRPGTCAEVALCRTTGMVAEVPAGTAADAAAQHLAAAIAKAEQLDAEAVQLVGLTRFDAARHFRVLAHGHDG